MRCVEEGVEGIFAQMCFDQSRIIDVRVPVGNTSTLLQAGFSERSAANGP